MICYSSNQAHFVDSLCKMNTSFKNVVNFEVDESSTIEKVLAFIAWILLQFPCNGMMLGLIQFERLGGDPLKRRLTDQVRKLKNILLLLSFFYLVFLILFRWYQIFFAGGS